MSSKLIAEMFKSPIGAATRLKSYTVSTSDPVYRIVKKMIKENVGAVVVVENKNPVGIITEKDLLERVVEPDKDVKLTLAENIMSKPIISIEYDHSLKDALELMRKNNLRRLVVMKKGILYGLVTERRLLQAAAISIGAI